MDVYHVLNRGVDKRDVVIDDSDRLRFVHSLFVFNDKNPLDENHRRPGTTMAANDRDVLVHVHAWCLMNNHYHLLLSPVDDDPKNISQFMKKLNMGYARYFNERHKRSGYLWQGKYKKVLALRDSHFMYLPYYIHLNPLDYKYTDWRKGKVVDNMVVSEYLKTYRWSSYLDYNSTKNFPSIVTKDLLNSVLGENANQNKQITKLITDPNLAQASQIIE
ncbi:MAG: transposase [Candidatus Paceibacteria bacterium]